MLYNILPIFVIIFSLGVIIFILLRKMSKVAVVDMKKIPAEVQGKVKRDLLEKRIERKLDDLGLKIKPLNKEIIRFFKNSFGGLKRAVVKLENKYKKKSKESIKEEPNLLKEKIFLLLEEAASLVEGGELEEAEKKYLELISLDQRNIMAYAGLGEIYYKRKELEGAREAMEYVFKLADNGYGEVEATDFVLLGLIYRDLGSFKKAFSNIKKAVEMEPNNPRNLDLLAEISIISKNKEEASKACERLIRVNPRNEKIKEFRKKIREL